MRTAGRPVTLGAGRVDDALGAALMRGALHECFAASTADIPALAGFAAGLAVRAGGGRRKTVWIRQRMAALEAGQLYGPGLAAMGCDPASMIFVQLPHARDVLRAGLEALACAPLAAVVMEIWGEPAVLDLTATRRLGLAAERSGVTPLLLHAAARPRPSSAMTRWQVAGAPSRALAAGAPGLAAFEITLLRNRAGPSGRRWHLEWDHERRCFCEAAPLSGGLVSVPAGRSLAPPATAEGLPLARTG